QPDDALPSFCLKPTRIGIRLGPPLSAIDERSAGCLSSISLGFQPLTFSHNRDTRRHHRATSLPRPDTFPTVATDNMDQMDRQLPALRPNRARPILIRAGWVR